jgi:hypothetical protein
MGAADNNRVLPVLMYWERSRIFWAKTATSVRDADYFAEGFEIGGEETRLSLCP